MQLRRSSRKCKFRHKVRCSLLKCNLKVNNLLRGSNKLRRNRRCNNLKVSSRRLRGSNRRSSSRRCNRRTNRPHLRAWQHSKPNRHKDVPHTES